MPDWNAPSVIVPPHTEGFGLGGKMASQQYLDRVREYAGAAERAGVGGAFVYDFPLAMDPWLAAFDVLVSSAGLQPIVAVRPHQEAPESVARRVLDLGYRFGRPTHVNAVSGATRPSRAGGDLEDKAAARGRLGRFTGELRAELDRRIDAVAPRPSVYTPSSGTPGVVPADCALMMARPRAVLAQDVRRVRETQGVHRVAMLVGLVVRPDAERAWEAAAALYPRDRRQIVAGRMFMSQVVSTEHLASYAHAEQGDVHDELLWYGAPARGIDAPKLVGSVPQVAAWLRSCRDLGVTELIVDLPPDPAEYDCLPDVLA